MAGARCFVAGLAGVDIVVVRVEGGFGNQGGSVALVPSDGSPAPMEITRWTDQAVIARVPIAAPGEGPHRIRVTTSGGPSYETGDVTILGPPGSGYPPMH